MNVVWRSPRGLPSVWSMRRITILSAGLLTAAVLLTGCSAGGAARDESGVSAPQVPAPVTEDLSSEADGGTAGLADDAARSVIVTGSMTVTTEEPAAAAREAVRLVEEAGGRVDGRSEYAPTGGDAGSASLTLRIPAEKLQDVIDDLSGLGRADEITTSTTDVTVAVADLESRIATQRGIIERLNALFGQAGTIADLVELETRIAEHQATLEDLEAQQRSVADQVALSTLSLYLRSEAEAPAQEPLDFLSGLQAGWGAFVAFFSGLLVALGVLLPWLALAGIVTAVVILLVKRRRATRSTPSA